MCYQHHKLQLQPVVLSTTRGFDHPFFGISDYLDLMRTRRELLGHGEVF